MSEPTWISVTGIATGLIGAITGVAGSIMGFVSLKKVNAIKAIDLRIELKKLSSAVRVSLEELDARMRQSDLSRRRSLAARGMFKSSMMDQWQARLEEDQQKVSSLTSEIAKAMADVDALGIEHLEHRLAYMHETLLRIQSLAESYKEALDSDAKESK